MEVRARGAPGLAPRRPEVPLSGDARPGGAGYHSATEPGT